MESIPEDEISKRIIFWHNYCVGKQTVLTCCITVVGPICQYNNRSKLARGDGFQFYTKNNNHTGYFSLDGWHRYHIEHLASVLQLQHHQRILTATAPSKDNYRSTGHDVEWGLAHGIQGSGHVNSNYFNVIYIAISKLWRCMGPGSRSAMIWPFQFQSNFNFNFKYSAISKSWSCMGPGSRQTIIWSRKSQLWHPVDANRKWWWYCVLISHN